MLGQKHLTGKEVRFFIMRSQISLWFCFALPTSSFWPKSEQVRQDLNSFQGHLEMDEVSSLKESVKILLKYHEILHKLLFYTSYVSSTMTSNFSSIIFKK